MNRVTRSIFAKTQVRFNNDNFEDDINNCVKKTVYHRYYSFSDNIYRYKKISHKRISILNLTSVDAVYRMRKEYGDNARISLLNFASFISPGGLFLSGSNAQEESICAESILYNVLSHPYINGYYDHNDYQDNILNHGLYHNCGLYTPDIIFNSDNYDEYVKADVMTISAPFWKKARTRYDVSIEKIHQACDDRVHTVFEMAREHNVDVLILGAFGCGVFGCDPKIMCNYFKKYMNKYYGEFDIIFAIPKNKDMKNYSIFKEMIDK